MDPLIYELIKWSCREDPKAHVFKSCLLVKVGEFCINMLDVPQVIKGSKLLGEKIISATGSNYDKFSENVL